MTSEKLSRVGYRHALASPELRALLAAQLISVGGTSVAAVGLTVLVYDRTTSPVLASLTFALGFLPYLVVGALLSSVADRVRPRRLVTCCDGASALLAVSMAWPSMPVPALLGLLFVIGGLSSLASGSRAALVRMAVSEEAYVPGRSLMRIAAQLAQLGGNAGAGVLLLVVSPGGALLVNGASFAFSAVTIRFVVRDYDRLGSPGADRVQGSLRGARTVLANAELRRLLLLGWLVPMFAVAPEAVAAPYVASQHASSSLVGWWLMALPVGIIAGDVLGVRLLSASQQRRLVIPAAAAGFLPYLVFAADPDISLAIPLLVVAGVCAVYGLGLDARVRDAAPPPLFARTMTVNSAGLMALQGAGFALAGALAQALGAGMAIALSGGCGIVTVFLLSGPGFRYRRITTSTHDPEGVPCLELASTPDE
ncbi:MAG TPA: MFS transporter [Streptosporangiaceae bacterium]|nr:MFS transporter [Streptosporangiaceae bacterium]